MAAMRGPTMLLAVVLSAAAPTWGSAAQARGDAAAAAAPEARRSAAAESAAPKTTRPPGAAPVRRVQVGLASFYGPGFNGDETASGEVFDQRKLVAAHRTLPLGSVVRVTNLENGRRVVLRVIDRGPYGRNHRKGCIIDVSKGAAHQLGFVKDGLSRVRVDLLHLPASADQE